MSILRVKIVFLAKNKYSCFTASKLENTLVAETFAMGKIREIFAFREHKLSRIGHYRIFRVLNFREFGRNSLKFLLLKY